jgi:hypothetical protein
MYNKNSYKGQGPVQEDENALTRKEVRRQINSALRAKIEEKNTLLVGNTSVSRSGTIVPVTQNLIRGDASTDQCNGTLVFPTYYRFSGNAYSDQTYSVLRVLVFRWRDLTTPAPAQVLAITGTEQAPHFPINWVLHRKIKVLHDEVVALKPRAGTGSYDNQLIKFEFKMENIAIQLPTTGSGASPVMNGIYLLFISDDLAISFPGISYVSELRFTDA